MKYKHVGLIFTILLGFTSCATTNVKVNEVETPSLFEKNKAYIMFMRPGSYITGAGMRYPRIIEYNPKSDTINLVGEMSIGDKIIYPIEEGEHIFFTNYLFEIMSKIDAKNGQIYYSNVDRLHMDPNINNNSRDDLLKLLKNSKCDKQLLDNYMFVNSTTNEDSSNTSYKSPLLIKMNCYKEEVREVKEDYFLFDTIDDLKKETELVTPSERSITEFNKNSDNYKKEIKSYYLQWKEKLEDTTFPSTLKIDKTVSNTYYKQFDNIKIEPTKNTITSDGRKKLESNIQNAINNKTLKLDKKENTLTMKYSILKYSEGSQVGRYLQLSVSSLENTSVIHLKVDFYNSENTLISTVEISDFVIGGILGGFNNSESNVIKLLEQYIKRNLIKEI